ncbi:MAG TPA: hypothetical protein VN653_00735 [Anaerolineales bacterium]|nr:hypothetical protein [Anaerolineales bacterium]
MEQFTGLISILLEHSQRFFDVWNFQIVISGAAVGFVLSNQGLIARNWVRMNITILFILIAIFGIYTLSIHNQREILLWDAIQSRIQQDAVQLTAAETEYLAALKPVALMPKAVVLIFADALVIAMTWITPGMKY